MEELALKTLEGEQPFVVRRPMDAQGVYYFEFRSPTVDNDPDVFTRTISSERKALKQSEEITEREENNCCMCVSAGIGIRITKKRSQDK